MLSTCAFGTGRSLAVVRFLQVEDLQWLHGPRPTGGAGTHERLQDMFVSLVLYTWVKENGSTDIQINSSEYQLVCRVLSVSLDQRWHPLVCQNVRKVVREAADHKVLDGGRLQRLRCALARR